MRAVSIAFPSSSLESLGLRNEFLDLFGAHDRAAFVASLKASPRVQAIAMEMLSPKIEGRTGQLLLSAHATEILARAMFALRGKDDFDAVTDQKRMRLQAVGDLIKSDLRHPWTIAELARHAGLGRRSFNAQFRRMYGVSASDFLRTSRLATAHDALLHLGLSVNEAAYAVGYANPANFSTAFRKHFGYVPSSCHRDKLS
jgi:transcriptional regulator GlxA family with amidase domain